MRTRHHHRTAFLAVILAALIALTGFAFISARGVKAVNIAYNQNAGGEKDISTKKVKGRSKETIEQLLRDNGYAIDRDKYAYSVNLKKKVGEISGVTITKKAKGTVTIDGKTVKFDSAEKTVGAMLNAIGVKIGSDDIVTPSVDTALTTKITAVDVVRVTKTTVTNEQSLPYQTKIVASDAVSDGQAQVVTAGVSGTQNVATQATYHNGVLTEESETAREVTKAPTTATIAVSTADYQKTQEAESKTTDATADTANQNATASTAATVTKAATVTTTAANATVQQENTATADTTAQTTATAKNTATTGGGGEDQNIVKVYTDSLSQGESKDITPTGSSVKMLAIGTKVATPATTDTTADETAQTTTDQTASQAASQDTSKTSSTQANTAATQPSSSSTKNTQTSNTSTTTQSATQNASQTTSQSTSQTAAAAKATVTAKPAAYNTLSASGKALYDSKGATLGHKTESVSASDLDFICAVVAAEDNTSYKGALAVISCVMNRVDSGNWGGKTAVAVLKAKGQFAAYLDGPYKKYLGGKYPSYVKAAVTDCLNGGLRNHSYNAFRANKFKTVNSVQIGGNYFANL